MAYLAVRMPNFSLVMSRESPILLDHSASGSERHRICIKVVEIYVSGHKKSWINFVFDALNTSPSTHHEWIIRSQDGNHINAFGTELWMVSKVGRKMVDMTRWLETRCCQYCQTCITALTYCEGSWYWESPSFLSIPQRCQEIELHTDRNAVPLEVVLIDSRTPHADWHDIRRVRQRRPREKKIDLHSYLRNLQSMGCIGRFPTEWYHRRVLLERWRPCQKFQCCMEVMVVERRVFLGSQYKTSFLWSCFHVMAMLWRHTV